MLDYPPPVWKLFAQAKTRIVNLETELRQFGATDEQIAEYRIEAQNSPLSPTEYLAGKLRQWKKGGR